MNTSSSFLSKQNISVQVSSQAPVQNQAIKNADNLFPFTPAILREFESGWVIEYYVLNPETMSMERHRQKFQRMRRRFPNDAAARKAAQTICKGINQKLHEGWNPSIDMSNPRLYTKLFDAIERFHADKTSEVREDSERCYASQVRMLRSWLTNRDLIDLYVKDFTPELADEYLNEALTKKKISALTYNNYIIFLRGMWKWFVKKKYCKVNAFEEFSRKKVGEKTRDIIPPEWDSKIMEYCISENPRFALVCQLVYSSFLRPAEICRIRIADIHFDKQAVLVQSEDTKMGRTRWAVLTPDTLELMRDMNLDRYPKDYYLLQGDLTPGTNKTTTRILDRHWDTMRTALEMPKKYQLYSYRDTGITFLRAQGVPDYLISSIVGHLNEKMLNKYTHAPKREDVQIASKFLPSLGKRKDVDFSQTSAYLRSMEE